jgi:dipeptidase E
LGKLFLSGGGNANKTKKLDRLFEAHIPKNKPVLYIPIAMPQKKFTFGQCYDWIRVVFPKQQIDLWTDLSDRNFEDMEKYGAIYIGGGNTFTLLYLIRKTKFEKLLTKYYKQGGIIYGGSAGAIIFGKDIRIAGFGGDSDRNIVGLTDFSGLNLVNGFSVKCHYTADDDNDLFYYSKKNKISVLGLPEDTGVVIEGKNMKVIGETNVVLFNKSSKVVYFHGSVI